MSAKVWLSVLVIGMTFVHSPAQAGFAVTGVALAASPQAFEGCCPARIRFSGVIAANGKGIVRYTFIRSDGATAPVQSLTFLGPGKKSVGTTWTLGGSGLTTYSGWEAVKVLSPNPTTSAKAAFHLTCLFQDPAAFGLRFVVLSKDARWPTRGRIRIVGEVKNVGTTPFESDPAQAVVTLVETAPGLRPVTRAQRAIGDLAAGASLTLTYDRSWDTAVEFPPTYQLRITYDPDIYIDGNKGNDDCNAGNNSLDLAGTAINAAWR